MIWCKAERDYAGKGRGEGAEAALEEVCGLITGWISPIYLLPEEFNK